MWHASIKMLLIPRPGGNRRRRYFVYDEAAHVGKESVKIAAAERIFTLLPTRLGRKNTPNCGTELKRRQTPEALFRLIARPPASAVAQLQHAGRRLERNTTSTPNSCDGKIAPRRGRTRVMPYAEGLIDDVVAQGFIRENEKSPRS
jgi:hypothetical protein